MSRNRPRLALLADLLTASRLVLSIALIPVVAGENWAGAGGLTAAAWVTDFLDGRLARMAGVEGRLGAWDLVVDTAVGAALVLGFGIAGELSLWIAVVVLAALTVLFLAFDNAAAAMVIQAIGYGTLLLLLWADARSAFWALVVIVVIIGVLDWRTLFLRNLPTFLRGLKGRPPIS